MSSTTKPDTLPLDNSVEEKTSADAVQESQASTSSTETTTTNANSSASDGTDLDSKLAKLDLSSENVKAEESEEGRNEATKSPSDAADGLSEKKNERGNREGAQKTPKKAPTKPYINPDRFLTGGSPREKPSPEELEKKIARIRENNEKIKQRQLTIQADEDAFRATQSAELKKQAQNKKIQEGIDRNREQNAQRKMERMNNREWDSNKKRPGQVQEQKDKVVTPAEGTPAESTS